MSAKNLYPGRCAGFRDWCDQLVAALDAVETPADGICQHHGIYFSWRGLSVRLLHYQKNTLLVIERPLSRCGWKEAHGRARIVGLRGRTFRRLADCFALAAGAKITTSWNGKDGSESGSFVLDWPYDAATRKEMRWPWLVEAISNYHHVGDCFKFTDDETARWDRFHADLKAATKHVNRPRRDVFPAYHKIERATFQVIAEDDRRMLQIEGELFTPSDHPVDDRAEKFMEAVTTLTTTAQQLLDCKALAVNIYPDPNQ